MFPSRPVSALLTSFGTTLFRMPSVVSLSLSPVKRPVLLMSSLTAFPPPRSGRLPRASRPRSLTAPVASESNDCWCYGDLLLSPFPRIPPRPPPPRILRGAVPLPRIPPRPPPPRISRDDVRSNTDSRSELDTVDITSPNTPARFISSHLSMFSIFGIRVAFRSEKGRET